MDEGKPEEEAATQGMVFRQLFEHQLHPLPEAERAERARSAEDPQLSAYCFDPVASVILSALENQRFGLMHARLVVRHHRTSAGLEAVCKRAAFAADSGLRRWLIRNPQLTVGLFRRLFTSRRLLELHKLSQDRDLPENSRRFARELARQRFTSGASEEKVELILLTEGRALASLSGIPLDAKSCALLCAQSYRSQMLVQNLARWSTAPPALIAHLLKQEIVRRQPHLKALLSRHPHAPAEAKRGVT